MIVGHLRSKDVVANHPLRDKHKFKLVKDKMATNPWFLGIRGLELSMNWTYSKAPYNIFFTNSKGLNTLET